MALDDFTKLLIHFNGNDGDTTFTDNGVNTHALVANGNVQIDDAQSVFGGESCLFDGTEDYIEAADHNDWALREAFGDPFTIDFRIRFNSISGGTAIIGQEENALRRWGIFINSSGNLQLHSFHENFGGAGHAITATWGPSLNTWYHVALVVDESNNGYVFVDGVALTLAADISGLIADNAGPLQIGKYSLLGNELNGWLDELRISKGVARWTADFTPPTSEYAGLVNDITITLPMFSVDLATGPMAYVELPPFSVLAAGAAGATLTLPIFTVDAAKSLHESSLTLPIISAFSEVGYGASMTLPSITVFAEQKNIATSSITFPKLTTDTIVYQGHVESFNLTLPMFTVNAFSGHGVSIELPSLSAVVSGSNANLATLDQSLPRMTVSIEATQHIFATFDVTLPRFNFNASLLTGIVSVSGSNRTLPLFTTNLHAYRGENGDGAMSMPIFTTTAFAPAAPDGTLSQSLKMLTLDAFADNHINRIV